jgi:hypothetical protein
MTRIAFAIKQRHSRWRRFCVIRAWFGTIVSARDLLHYKQQILTITNANDAKNGTSKSTN